MQVNFESKLPNGKCYSLQPCVCMVEKVNSDQILQY